MRWPLPVFHQLLLRTPDVSLHSECVRDSFRASTHMARVDVTFLRAMAKSVLDSLSPGWNDAPHAWVDAYPTPSLDRQSMRDAAQMALFPTEFRVSVKNSNRERENNNCINPVFLLKSFYLIRFFGSIKKFKGPKIRGTFPSNVSVYVLRLRQKTFRQNFIFFRERLNWIETNQNLVV